MPSFSFTFYRIIYCEVLIMDKALVDGEFFRVMPIVKVIAIDNDGNLTMEDLELSEGLAIEQKEKDGHCSVVAFIRPDEDGELIFEDIAFRSVDCIDQTKPLQIEEYKNCIDFARHALRDILGE